MSRKVWDEITYSFPKFNGYAVEFWEWISNFIPHFTGHAITFLYWDYRVSTTDHSRLAKLEMSSVTQLKYSCITD